jgi:sterol desaturase/sphingolipid hydroxylase (fatty acid hydroxylase superfamily)
MMSPQLGMFAQAFLGQSVTYFTLVGVVYLLVWRWGEERFRGRRIQARKRCDARQIAFEVRNTLVTLATGTATATVLSLLYASGRTKLTPDAESLGWPTIAATFVAFIVFNDVWFYGWHRLLHHPWLFRRVHALHHKSVDVNPFSSYSFHFLEGFLLGAWVLPAVVLVPVYLPMLGVLQAIGLLNNVMSHLGYEFLPRWFVRIPPFCWLNTSTFHNLHHSKLNGNFGLFFRVWDRLLGTEVASYERVFTERGGASSVQEASPR